MGYNGPPSSMVKNFNIEASEALTGYKWKKRNANASPKTFDTGTDYPTWFPAKKDIGNGDIFGSMSFTGIGPLLQYGTGGRLSHIAQAVWGTDENGNDELYVIFFSQQFFIQNRSSKA